MPRSTTKPRPADPAKPEASTQARSLWHLHVGYQEILGADCAVTLEQRPRYCDRGNFLATLHATGNLKRDLDACGGWPRYYFDETRAKQEIEAWMRKRKVWVE